MRLDTGTKVQDRRSGTVYVIVSSAPRGFGFDPDTGDAPELGRHYVLEDPEGNRREMSHLDLLRQLDGEAAVFQVLA